jgi:hypothetical protein
MTNDEMLDDIKDRMDSNVDSSFKELELELDALVKKAVNGAILKTFAIVAVVTVACCIIKYLF